MKTTNKFLALALMAVPTVFASCSKDDVKSSEEPVVRLAKFHDYLYGMEYDDYDFVAGKNKFEEMFHIPQKVGCSQVRKGNFVGRNLDFYINSDLNAVVRVNHKGEPENATVSDLSAFYTSRYASIGVTGCSPDFTTEKVLNTTDFLPVYEILPINTLDGINENGVYVALDMDATGKGHCNDGDTHCYDTLSLR